MNNLDNRNVYLDDNQNVSSGKLPTTVKLSVVYYNAL